MAEIRSERRVILFLASLTALLAYGIDVSLPAFDELRDHFDLAEGSGQVSLVVTFYFLGLAVGQLVYGPFADRFGRIPVLMVGLATYALGAAGSAAATSVTMLMAARLVWGLGAASGAVIYPAIARDLYDGDRMARVMTLVFAVFLIGPMVAPGIGELILLTGSWRAVFVSGLVLALLVTAWAARFGETLRPERRRPLRFGATLVAFREVFRTRPAVGYMLATTFAQSAFFIYLGSGQPIIDEIYGYADWFALIFAAVAVVIATTLLFTSRLTTRYGAVRVMDVATMLVVGFSAMAMVVALATDGRPAFGLWFAVVAPSLAAMAVVTPTGLTLGLQPMERMAGTAAAVFGIFGQGVAALLAAIFDRMIDDSVTPMMAGFLLYGSLAVVAARWARPTATERRRRPEVVEGVREAQT